jgi:hypothetical protein
MHSKGFCTDNGKIIDTNGKGGIPDGTGRNGVEHISGYPGITIAEAYKRLGSAIQHIEDMKACVDNLRRLIAEAERED